MSDREQGPQYGCIVPGGSSVMFYHKIQDFRLDNLRLIFARLSQTNYVNDTFK